MNGLKGALVAAICLFGAGALQPLAPRLALCGVRPDYMLIVLGPLCLLASRRGGTLLGFFAGVIAGSLSGANMAHYVISRTVGGFFVSSSRSMGLSEGPATVALTTFALTIVAQLVLMFLAPPARIMGFLGATMGTAVLNGVLAVFVHFLLSKIVDPVKN